MDDDKSSEIDSSMEFGMAEALGWRGTSGRESG